MPAKVYWKSLRLVLNMTKRYISRWQLQLQASLTEEQYDCVVAVLEAIVACLALLPENTPVN